MEKTVMLILAVISIVTFAPIPPCNSVADYVRPVVWKTADGVIFEAHKEVEKAIEHLKKTRNLKRGEYETREEFERRKQQAREEASRYLSKYYRIKLVGEVKATLSYDADEQQFSFQIHPYGSEYVYACGFAHVECFGLADFEPVYDKDKKVWHNADNIKRTVSSFDNHYFSYVAATHYIDSFKGYTRQKLYIKARSTVARARELKAMEQHLIVRIHAIYTMDIEWEMRGPRRKKVEEGYRDDRLVIYKIELFTKIGSKSLFTVIE